MTAASAEPLELASARGERLSGILHSPGGSPRGVVVLSPCFTCTRDIAPVRNLARDLADAGYLAYRFDPVGIGKSDGAFEDATLTKYRDDLVLIARTLAPRAPALHLAGHSLGGVTSLLAAREAGAASVVTLASDARPDSLERLLGAAAVARAVTEGSVGFDAGDGATRKLSRALVLDRKKHDALAAAEKLTVPLLVVHGDRDQVVPLEAAELLAARARARLVVLPGGEHLLAGKSDRDRIRESVLAFIDR
jgi:putative redox protein